MFLPQVDFANLWSYSGGGLSGSSFIPLVEDASAEAVQANIQRFETFCKENGINYKVHKDYLNFALPELKKETRFADLLLVSSQTFYEQAGTDDLNYYLKETLAGVECPVLVVPEQFSFPESIILTYDGSEASVFAIKQFAYLFPELRSVPSIVVFAGEKQGESVPGERDLRELVSQHFPHAQFSFGETPKKFFTTWLADQRAPLLVSGSFGRSEVSRLFKKSFVTGVISEHRVPVFVAHK